MRVEEDGPQVGFGFFGSSGFGRKAGSGIRKKKRELGREKQRDREVERENVKEKIKDRIIRDFIAQPFS